MNIVLVAMVLLVSLFHAAGAAAQGSAEAGRTLWTGNVTECRYCHGSAGEGGFGPDLAGRGLSIEQFRHATRTPWGIMPAYTAQQVSDSDIANLVAWFNSLPRVATPGPWRVPIPAGAPAAQQLHIGGVGCGQCHGPVFEDTRGDAGAAGADFAWFANLVYNHTAASPEERRLSGTNPDNPIRMGNYSRMRLPETLLRDIWEYVSVDLGLRVPIDASLSAGTPSGPNVTYTLTVENEGVPGKGLVAEDLSIALTIPAGSRVVSADGPGYQGVRRDAVSGADVAVWTLARMGPTQREAYAITIAPPAPGARALQGSVRWARPALGDGSMDSAEIDPPPALQQ